MSKKRDYIAEILEIKGRSLKRTDRYNQFYKRYDPVVGAHVFLKFFGTQDPEVRSELLKYIPIGTLACLEGYFRMVIRDLIDYGEPYQSNAYRLDDIKVDIGVVLNLGREKVSS